MQLSLDLEQYILDHISEEHPVLKELDRETHITCLQPRMLSGHLQGKILTMLCHMIQPNRILELGTFTGYSAISMALALNEDGKLFTIEISDEREEIIQQFVDKANLTDKVECLIGDAIEIIPTLTEQFDLVFIDADKRKYCEYFDLVFSKVRKGGYIIADNTLWDGKVIDLNSRGEAQTEGILAFNEKAVNNPDIETVIFPIRDGMTVIRKLV